MKMVAEKKESLLESYAIESDGIPAGIRIYKPEGEFGKLYEIKEKRIGSATEAVLEYIRSSVLKEVQHTLHGSLSHEEASGVENEILTKTKKLIENEIVGISPSQEKILMGIIRHELFGLGEIELLLSDHNLEEIVINCAAEPIYVYHKRQGWLKTNVSVPDEEKIKNYATIIARRVNRQVSSLTPLLDAQLESGDRANAVLFPIGTKGNSITIRKFAKNPWSLPRMLVPDNQVMSLDVAALLWLCVQYEMNIIVSGGTASGKTSVLNALLNFIPPDQRIISIEDTREIVLPDYLHWVPMITRLPNPEGKGEVTMLDLLVNSLRMRPDRIVVGEVRRQREAEILFEAMHTGHSVYGTIHADTAEQVRTRLINPPINLPESMITSIHLVLVQYRQRRTGIRRTFEVAELVPIQDGEKAKVNVLYRWDARTDRILPVGGPTKGILTPMEKSQRIFNELMLFSGFTQKEIIANVEEKKQILRYLVDKKIYEVNEIEKIVAGYYNDRDEVLKMIKKG